MRVGLIDVDGHNFPNLCLMKLSAYFTLGDSVDGKRMMLRSGAGKPVEILMEEFDRKSMRWGTIGYYTPKFCPNCGRKLVENERSFTHDQYRSR